MPRNPAKRLFFRLSLPFWWSRHRSCVTILMLHGVMDTTTAAAAWVPLRHNLPPASLEEGLTVLARRYHFISLERAVAMLDGREPAEPHCMVLTFDDGYRNNLSHALPILRKHAVPMTMFLSTGHISRREPFWYDRMDFALQHLKASRVVSWGGRRLNIEPADRDGLRRSFAEFRRIYKEGREPYAATVHRLESLISELEADAGCRLQDRFEDDPWTALVDWNAVREAAADGVTFGSHTVDHLLLDRLDDAAVREQLTNSAHELAAHTGGSCDLLCYPNGNWSTRVVAIAKECGYRAAVTTRPGVNRHRHANLLILKRNGFSASCNALSILATASGMADYLDLRRSAKEL